MLPLTSPLTMPADAMLLRTPPVFQLTTSGRTSVHSPFFMQVTPISSDGADAAGSECDAEGDDDPETIALMTVSDNPAVLSLIRSSTLRSNFALSLASCA